MLPEKNVVYSNRYQAGPERPVGLHRALFLNGRHMANEYQNLLLLFQKAYKFALTFLRKLKVILLEADQSCEV